MTTRFWGRWASLSVLLLCAGCATPYKRAEIPLGEWTGNGRFVCAVPASEEGKENAALKTSDGTYPTHLKIERVPGAHVDSRRLEILSQRGKIENLEGDRTHLIGLLEPVEGSADKRITIYRVTKGGHSFDAKPPDVKEGPEGPAHASCVVVDGNLVLRIHYMDGLVDTFRFRGDLLSKDGSYSDEIDQGFIHWSERLRRQR